MYYIQCGCDSDVPDGGRRRAEWGGGGKERNIIRIRRLPALDPTLMLLSKKNDTLQTEALAGFVMGREIDPRRNEGAGDK
jgi:hypothetical protein